MSGDPTCDFCMAGPPNLRGICTECDGCFGEHCRCDPCQHGKTRTEECVFCGRGFKPLIEVLPSQDKIEADLLWLLGPDQEMA